MFVIQVLVCDGIPPVGSVSAYAFHVRICLCLLGSLCAGKFAYRAYSLLGGTTDTPRLLVLEMKYRYSTCGQSGTGNQPYSAVKEDRIS